MHVWISCYRRAFSVKAWPRLRCARFRNIHLSTLLMTGLRRASMIAQSFRNQHCNLPALSEIRQISRHENDNLKLFCVLLYSGKQLK